MCDFKVGDEVVCVDDKPRRVPSGLVEGRVYTVMWVGLGHGGVAMNVRLAEALHDPRCMGFYADRFRKVQRRDLQAWLSTAVPAPHLDKRPKKRVRA